MVLAWLTAVLCDNGVNAYYEERSRIKAFSPIDPAYSLGDRPYNSNTCWLYDAQDRTPIHIQYLNHFEKYYGPLKVDWEKRDHVPVKYHDIHTPAVDVALNTRTGKFTLYKWWPYFPELKRMLIRARITFVDMDLDWRETYGIKGLNYVKRAKLYVGLDTGMAHYVSMFANGKALIINGGYVDFEYWSTPYDYEVLQIEDMPCRPCLLNKITKRDEGRVCEHGQRCMREISPKMVFDRIIERLEG